jgi:hypothetical protein
MRRAFIAIAANAREYNGVLAVRAGGFVAFVGQNLE